MINKGIVAIIGGPPCQDFSIVRGPTQERQGLTVKRGKLYERFIKSLLYLQPDVFAFENVPGLMSANKGSAYKTILEDFSDLNKCLPKFKQYREEGISNEISGYEIVFSDIVDSSKIGVPQKRKRLLIVGLRKNINGNGFGLSNKIKQNVEKVLGGSGNLFERYPLTSMEVLEGLPLPDLAEEYRYIMQEYSEITNNMQTKQMRKWKEDKWSSLSFDIIKDYCNLHNIPLKHNKWIDKAFEEHADILKRLGYYKKKLDGVDFADGSNRLPNESEAVLDRMKMIPPDENHNFVRNTKWEVEGRGMSLIYRRLHPLKPSYTVVAYGGGGTWGYHYRRNRSRLTNRERARLQTFPDWFQFSGSSAAVRAQIGEAVPVLLGEKVADVLEMAIETSRGCH
ncbi:hypothetical protein ES703_106605 [subsurface metagenome]